MDVAHFQRFYPTPEEDRPTLGGLWRTEFRGRPYTWTTSGTILLAVPYLNAGQDPAVSNGEAARSDRVTSILERLLTWAPDAKLYFLHRPTVLAWCQMAPGAVPDWPPRAAPDYCVRCAEQRGTLRCDQCRSGRVEVSCGSSLCHDAHLVECCECDGTGRVDCDHGTVPYKARPGWLAGCRLDRNLLFRALVDLPDEYIVMALPDDHTRVIGFHPHQPRGAFPPYTEVWPGWVVGVMPMRDDGSGMLEPYFTADHAYGEYGAHRAVQALAARP